MLNPSKGDIILTRNSGGIARNPTPGYFNHASVYCDGYVVEAQRYVKDGKISNDKKCPGEVIRTKDEEFFSRYEIYKVKRLLQIYQIYSELVCEYADSLVGVKYSRLSSLSIGNGSWVNGVNCVSVVRFAVFSAIGNDPGWRVPDDINYSPILFD